jgi:MFS family permease
MTAGMSGVLLPACSPYLRARGLGDEQFSWLFVILLGAAVITAIVRSTVAARVPLHLAFATGGLLVMFSQALIGFANRFENSSLPALMITACTIQGVGGSLLGISGNNAAVCLFPHRRAFALGLFHASAGIGATLGPFIVAGFGAEHWWYGPRIAALVLLAGSIWGFARGHAWGLRLGNARIANDKETTRYSSGTEWYTIAVFYGICEATIMYWSVLCLVENGGLSPHAADQSLASFWLAMTVARVALSWLYRALPRRPILTIHMACLAASFWLIGHAQTQTMALFALVLGGIAASVVYPLVMALATESSQRNTSRVVAMITMSTTVGQAIGAWLTGQLADRIGFDRAFFLAATWGIFGAIVAVMGSYRIVAAGRKNHP